jgi:hypothetical protein
MSAAKASAFQKCACNESTDSYKWQQKASVAFRLFFELRTGARIGAGCDGHSKSATSFASAIVQHLDEAASVSGCRLKFVSTFNLGNLQDDVVIPWGIAYCVSMECPRSGPAALVFAPEKLVIAEEKRMRSIKYGLRTDFESLLMDLRYPETSPSELVVQCPGITLVA